MKYKVQCISEKHDMLGLAMDNPYGLMVIASPIYVTYIIKVFN